MWRFITGLGVGLAIGAAGSLSAAQMVGSAGYLSGWTVTKDGDEICYMPFVWVTMKEIECD